MSDTDFKAVPMQFEEARYSYRNSQQISSQTGLIGYLRADMGTNGNEFWSTWNDYRKDLKTDDFKSEFDDVINSFREQGQFLSDRQIWSNGQAELFVRAMKTLPFTSIAMLRNRPLTATCISLSRVNRSLLHR